MEKESSLRILDGDPSKVSSDEGDARILPNITYSSLLQFSTHTYRFGSVRVESSRDTRTKDYKRNRKEEDVFSLQIGALHIELQN